MTQSRHTITARRVTTLSGLVLCLILLPFLVLNLSIIIQSATRPDQLPTVLGHKALILLPDSAEGQRAVGIIRTVDAKTLQPEDLIAYRQEQTFFIEKVTQVNTDEGQLTIRTTSGPESDAYLTTVPPSQIEGILVQRIPRIGGWALFMQTPLGLLLFMVLPVFIFLMLDAWNRNGKHTRSVVTESI